ncbi:3-oxoadipate enol-lactonase [Devosia sp.]|uniref:3-oxoadipate enol-lactonase n=1 Tax=Devosia sp. TaxID=1871048 RepID=UPI002AFDEE10|nr:3-oxoadipate enol-lactonase [Devosia sp.]
MFTRVNGVLLSYRLAGRAGAPELVFINSLGTDARIWDDVIALLGGHYHILSYDKRGHGLSDSPAGAYGLDGHLDDLAGLLDHVGMTRPALCGVSVGGLIAQGFALRHPERVAALVLCAAAPRFGDAAGWAARIEAVRAGGPGAIADAVMERWFSPGFRHNRADDLAGWKNLFLRTDPAGYIATCATLRDTDLTTRIGAIAAPTLVVAGEEDRAIPLADVHALAGAIPGARFTALAGAGHIPGIEQPEALAALMTDFLTEVGHG